MCFWFQSLLTDHAPSILEMTIDCRIPTEQEADTYEQDHGQYHVPIGCKVDPNCEKCLADIN
jgi:hypothetical protein